MEAVRADFTCAQIGQQRENLLNQQLSMMIVVGGREEQNLPYPLHYESFGREIFARTSNF